ncbi:hypothetical protein [Thermoleophilum album]|nr:hypothetical protein [Thermoleophilum album]
MAFRDEGRRPLLLILLVVVPAYAVLRSIATTEETPRRIGLPGDLSFVTTMKDIHGAVMAGQAIAFVAALCGVFVMHAALQGDRRLVIAGYRPGETIVARLSVLAATTALVVGVSLGVTAMAFEPESWLPFGAATLLIGLIYAGLGALSGAILDKVAATYLMLFFPLTDLGIAQNPMFGDGSPEWWATLLPGYAPSRVMVDGALAAGFEATGPLALSVVWSIGIGAVVAYALRRSVAPVA